MESIATAAEFDTAYAEAICTSLQKCCEGAGQKPNPACKTESGRELADRGKVAGATYKPVKGAACVKAAKEAACSDSYPSFEPLADAACRGVYGSPDGTKAPGEACEEDGECAGGSSGKADCIGKEVRTCHTLVVAGVGELCFGVPASPTQYTRCAEGLQCDELGSKTCSKPGQAGDPCVGTSCAYPMQCTNSLCVQGKPRGSSCVTEADCASRSCVDQTCTLSSPGLAYCQ